MQMLNDALPLCSCVHNANVLLVYVTSAALHAHSIQLVLYKLLSCVYVGGVPYSGVVPYTSIGCVAGTVLAAASGCSVGMVGSSD
jgi:hypothetical protein